MTTKYTTLKHIVFSITLLLTILLMSSCSSSLPTLETNLRAATYLNPNLNGRASPVVVILYQLQEKSKFEQADFFSLYNKPAATLGAGLVDKREYEARPGKKVTLTQTILPSTNFIGIVVAYHNITKSHWRKVITIPKDKSITLSVDLETQGLQAKLN